ncbi:hypothetical protein HID58_047809 [Brassica napus]|uniref:Uncharacterized protein n=1 Tax=Brassica napus TaxID=3708 RepID=A0ABQ8B0E2_BRANA|nr:hypothetical protein HID58_047809 [Brassica napus]
MSILSGQCGVVMRCQCLVTLVDVILYSYCECFASGSYCNGEQEFMRDKGLCLDSITMRQKSRVFSVTISLSGHPTCRMNLQTRSRKQQQVRSQQKSRNEESWCEMVLLVLGNETIFFVNNHIVSNQRDTVSLFLPC